MNRYDARKLRQWWVDKTTGASSLVPAKSVPKTRAQQRLESLEKELDKYDLVEQGAYTKDPETGLLIPPGSEPNVIYSLPLPPWPTFAPSSGKSINFYTYGLETDEETAERARKEQEEKQAKLKAFSDKIESVGQQPSAVLEPHAPTEKRVPDYISCLTGWRGWRIKNGRLSALGKNDNWIPKMAVPAACRQDDSGWISMWMRGDPHKDDAPSMKCNCGYWSFKTREVLTQALEWYMASVDVIGSIDIWGKVIECENGYRSEYAYPKELWLLEPGLEYLSWTYGVPVRKMDGQ